MGKFINEQGNQYERWYVICEAGRNKHGEAMWLCICDCGEIRVVLGGDLRNGASQSCGCLQNERTSISNTKHGGSGTRIYKTWRGIKERCNNSNSKCYRRYGGRGIEICPEWLNDFVAFRDWALVNGYTDNLCIDRIDNDGNYEPENCQWLTRSENSSKDNYKKKKKQGVKLCQPGFQHYQ